MTLSAHRRMKFFKAVNRGPVSVGQTDGAVLLRYDGLLVNVSKRRMRVSCPFDQEEALYLESLGVLRRAQETVDSGEGVYDPKVQMMRRKAAFQAQVIDFRRRMRGAAQSAE